MKGMWVREVETSERLAEYGRMSLKLLSGEDEGEGQVKTRMTPTPHPM